MNSGLGPLVVGIAGTTLDAATADCLRHPAVGGVILFARNYESPGQLAELTGALRELRDPRLLIQVDQEGGRVQRFRDGFTPLPPLAVMGRWHAEHPERALDLAYRHGRVMAAEVLAAGVDQSLAPVLDRAGISGVIGDRALAAEPGTVAALAGHYIAGMRDAGMAACGKHFPGHGSVAPDTHDSDAVDVRGRAELERDLLPFRRLAGELPAIMSAHVTYPAVDESPAGFSRAWIEGILRTELGFAGAVISDDLDMVAARVAGGMPARLDAALEAGCDLALVCNPDSARDLVAGLDGSPADATERIRSLYGRPQFSLADQERVPEFRAWRDSLAALCPKQTEES